MEHPQISEISEKISEYDAILATLRNFFIIAEFFLLKEKRKFSFILSSLSHHYTTALIRQIPEKINYKS